MDRMMSGNLISTTSGSDEDDAEPGTAGRGLLGLLPGFGKIKKQLPEGALDPRRMKHMEAIVLSMTAKEKEQSQPVESVPPPPYCRGLRPSPDGGEQANQEFFRNAQDDVRQG